MDFGFTPQQERLRQELREFFASSQVQAMLRETYTRAPRQEMFSHELYKMMAERGWLAMHWPEAYGGQGKTLVETFIFVEEFIHHRVPVLPWMLTVNIFGNAILLLGTEEQKRKYLPPIARGDSLCNILYTEPDAGSDLASLRTRAVEEGDSYIIDGTKIFNSIGHLADHGLIVARTDPNLPKHKGLTLFIVDMHAPGVTVSPMWTLGTDRLNEIVFDNVRVPKQDMVGERNRGWPLLNAALAVERTGLDITTVVQCWMQDVLDHVRERGLGRDRWVRQTLAELYTELQVAKLLGWRVVSHQARAEVNDVNSAMSKMYGSELGKRITRVGMELMGLEGLLNRWDGEAPLDGWIESAYRDAAGWTIAAGTTEIMLYIIVYRGLKVHK